MMIWLVVALMAVSGMSYCVFALVTPPSFLRSFFKVPSLFLFLPDRLVLPVGRMAVGLLILVGAVAMAVKVAMAGYL